MRKISLSNGNDGQRSGRQKVYQRSGQREGSPNYVLLYSDGENSGDEETIALRTVSKQKSPPRKVEVMKIQLQPEDTLQALSLRYGCTISELKRINKIHKENEIFAHRTIKVPVVAFSLLTETLNQTENTDNNDGKIGDLITIEDTPANSSREEQIINLIALPTPVPPLKSNFDYTTLNTICETPANQCENTLDVLEDGENDQLLAAEESSPEQHSVYKLSCSGADWGLSWPQLVGCSLLLGLAGPLIIYFLFLAETSSKHHSSAGYYKHFFS
ncbi:lysM and putative peptidoglycan-binding domain-containing protein 3 isoform X1 [Neodiprion lecontei]|uniref:LysM and putative peptidoglycan-binding domain-containing protein 3 isoform X1 n=1 Tax=Neodiprion lecontei TaxID=441921 RepID=A0A6J0BGY3_NEOLC|nr:lysM and putative peptidoglycan-binding domain-containing protein 3 isoform X1 [Neodiprion lecontei]